MPAGAVAVICVALLTVKPVAGVAPNATPVAPVKLVPVTTTVVPPASGPAVGEIDVTVGRCSTMVESAADGAFVPPPPDSATEGSSGLVALVAKAALSMIVGPAPGPKLPVRVQVPVWPEPEQVQPVPLALV